jgi:hypothetical protein
MHGFHPSEFQQMHVIRTGNESRSRESAKLEVQYREIQELRKKVAEEEARTLRRRSGRRGSENEPSSKQ